MAGALLGSGSHEPKTLLSSSYTEYLECPLASHAPHAM